MARRRIREDEGIACVRATLRGDHTQQQLAAAVRFLLEELAARAPGNTVEVRVPPFGATQCVAGPKHTRGTPPNVIEVGPVDWVHLAVGRIDWQYAVREAKVTASGTRAHLDGVLPLFGDLL